MNAIMDMLLLLAVQHPDMPAPPERMGKAVAGSRAAGTNEGQLDRLRDGALHTK